MQKSTQNGLFLTKNDVQNIGRFRVYHLRIYHNGTVRRIDALFRKALLRCGGAVPGDGARLPADGTSVRAAELEAANAAPRIAFHDIADNRQRVTIVSII